MDRRRFLALGSIGVLATFGLMRRQVVASPDAPPMASAGTDRRSAQADRMGADAADRRGTHEPAGPSELPDRAGTTDPADPPAAPDTAGAQPSRPADANPDTGAAPTDPDAAADQADPDEPASPVDPRRRTATPREWGEHPTGVGRRLAGSDHVALTFDACGGGAGNGYDAALIDHLRRWEVPATLFLAGRWIEANPQVAAELAADPLFELANHGTQHLPLSVSGRSAYGITGTGSVDEVIAEVQGAQAQLTELIGSPPRWFRSGTAHYDEVAVAIVGDLGLQVAGYDVLGDAGATFSATQVRAAVTGARPGAVVLLHMNHPRSGTAAGIDAALAELRARGTTFTTLGDHRLV